MGLFNKGFYNLRQRDFTTVYARDLRNDDALGVSYGMSDSYGAIPLEIVSCDGDLVSVFYELPEGASVKSGERVEVDVYWKNGKTIVKVTQFFNARAKVQVLA